MGRGSQEVTRLKIKWVQKKSVKSHFSHKFFSLLILSLALSLSVGHLHAQEPKVIYLYDDLGRLVRVVNENNECATYEYDAVGNLLSITRGTNCLQPPTIDTLSQDTANAGDTTCITIRGTNFLGATVTTDNPDVQISRVRVSETSIEVCLVISPFATLGTARIIVTTIAGVVERAITINGRTLVITQNTSIGRFDRSFEGTDLTIQGPATVTIDGPHRFRSLTLRNNAVVTHPATTGISTSKLDLTVDTALTIDATSRIDVTALGFLAGGKSGNPFPGNPFNNSGMTVGFQRGSSGRSGGSYGGLGGSSGEGSASPVYGDFRNPNDPGSGGASFAGAAGNGGGLIRIVAQTLQLDGMIKADGETPANYAGGSGGGLRIDVGTLKGLGSISSNGSTGQRDNGGGGGGGRIAIYYQNVTGFDFTRVNAFGGLGNAAPNGGAGTIYLQGPARESGELIADNNNMASPSLSTPLIPTVLGQLNLTHLRVKRAAKLRVDDTVNLADTLEVSLSSELTLVTNHLSASTMNVTGSSLITHLFTTASASFKVDISASTLTVDATSKIDVTGRGFLGGGKPGNPFPADFGGSGMTVEFQRGSTGQSGGSYGGLGGSSGRSDRPESLRSAGPVYGDFRDPNEPGSGGASFSGPGGSGGGLIRIVVQTIQLDGAIKTDGETPTFFGAGSGGGIRIDVETLRGTGTISANGGTGQRDNGGGGGGGRIAIYYQDVVGFDLSKVTAFGALGNAAPNGGAGTIYLQGPARESGELIADNNNVAALTQSTPILSTPSGLMALTNLRVKRAARMRVDDEANFTGTLEVSFGAEFISAKRVLGSTIDVNNGAVITQLPTTATAFFKVDLNTSTLTVDATSKIDVIGRGFLGGGKPGNPYLQSYNNSGMTVGFQRGSTGQSGGSYGGLGGSSSGSSNPVYGDFRDPNDPGSGGAALFGPAGSGGGLIRIVAQTLQLDGMIKADGETPVNYAGGSGGGIRIDVGTIRGTGQVTANGGAGQRDNGGGGGGGRIAIYYQDAAGFDLNRITAFGGTGNSAPNGQDGSVITQQQVFP